MPVHGVGFDLDYTLILPEQDRATLLAEAIDEVDAPEIDREEYLDAHRRNLANETREPIFADLLDDHNTDTAPDELAAAYRDAINDALVPVDGAESLLFALREDYRVGVLTDGPSVTQRTKLEMLGWTDAFDVVVVSGDVGVGKPDPRTFDALIEALGTAPEETVYVGDHVEMDVGGAIDAGLRVVQVLFPGGPDPDPRAVAHVDRAELAAQLPALLDSLD